MKENWLALYLCIMKDYSSDKALARMHIQIPIENRRPYKKREHIQSEYEYIEDPIKLIELKKNYTYEQLAKIYNTYPHKIYHDIKHYKQINAN